MDWISPSIVVQSLDTFEGSRKFALHINIFFWCNLLSVVNIWTIFVNCLFRRIWYFSILSFLICFKRTIPYSSILFLFKFNQCLFHFFFFHSTEPLLRSLYQFPGRLISRIKQLNASSRSFFEHSSRSSAYIEFYNSWVTCF